jgi:2-succinyl-5-enolpyruvyl-6-hydroxy-3-cyclohexene-1-carboxylate synthase
MNKTLAVHVLQAFLDAGGEDICMCPGSRNAPLVSLVAANTHIQTYYFYEERSAAFFALGVSRRKKRPVAIITTSGTAAVELMPALMEAYYTATPLVAITADRPRSYRGTNAPQTCEQVGLYGIYASWNADVEGSEKIDLSTWDRQSPAHINVCFQEPLKVDYEGIELKAKNEIVPEPLSVTSSFDALNVFLNTVKNPLAIIGALDNSARACVKQILNRLNIPVYAESLSGLREDPSLAHLRIHQSANLWKTAAKHGYPIDGILRIGRIPTVRLWRDLEDLEGKVKVCSLSDVPYSGLSWGSVITTNFDQSLNNNALMNSFQQEKYAAWRIADKHYQDRLEDLFKENALAEPSLVHTLSKRIPEDSVVYLGNSMPIREWDLATPYQARGFDMWATRGLSGIDGQISTFLGLCRQDVSNWALLGDLTTLYDMAGLWAAKQLQQTSFNLVIVNNGGGQIFSRMYKEPAFLNSHRLRFKALADLWEMEYLLWEEIPNILPIGGQRIIELIPHENATKTFWQKAGSL